MWAFYLLKYVSIKSKKKYIIEDWSFSPRSIYELVCFKTLFNIWMGRIKGTPVAHVYPNRQSDDPPSTPVTRNSSMFFFSMKIDNAFKTEYYKKRNSKKGKKPHGGMGQVRIRPSVPPCVSVKVTGFNWWTMAQLILPFSRYFAYIVMVILRL